MASSFLCCEISGEPLSTIDAGEDGIVVTPSGHVCRKRLLLAKLTENGGMDPFQDGRPLSESELIALSPSSVPKTVPPRTAGSTGGASTFSSLLQTLSKEYDALVLELFDTRKVLEETRQELSQALYQNDAAVRVVARLAMERDTARQQLEQWKATGGGGGSAPEKRAAEETDGPPSKKIRADGDSSSDLPLTNDIPQEDADQMFQVWENLHAGRKAQQKAAAANAPSPEQLAAYKTNVLSWHKTKCKGVNVMAGSGDLLATAGSDKELILYDTEKGSVVQSIATGCNKTITSLDMNENVMAVGTAMGQIKVFSNADGNEIGSITNGMDSTTAVVDLRLHPDKTHLLGASESGRITIFRIGESSVTPIAIFKPDSETKKTCGALHPDGLIYLAGNAFGEILIWDLKGKSQAGSLKDEEGGIDAIIALSFSNNGYHVAASYASGVVRVWDLRKQKCVATLNKADDKDDVLESVDALAFDVSGKYLAYGGPKGVRVTTVKEWDTTASYEAKQATGLVWLASSGFLAASSKKQRQIGIFGTPEE